ncbi:kinase-like protein [Rickenella mellea]|uniref:Kinase-like protein n=1 Tax=Rickenella mellea TaxID=50990 RepID=A0A4Y7PPN0_9AGAM|nr:kinase-like protein [Rickenella mellea]
MSNDGLLNVVCPLNLQVHDDNDGRYIITPHDMIFRRYRSIRLLRQCPFDDTVEAVDTVNHTLVAIKIIRAVPKYRVMCKKEILVLQKLKEHDQDNKNKCTHLLSWFEHLNHICLVTELLGMSTCEFLRVNHFQPFPRKHIQDFARHLFGSIAFLHDLHLIHTDLKPECILLVRDAFRTVDLAVSKKKRILDDTDIRLTDFGSATFESEHHSTIISTRHYRAPEIILGLGWSYPCDVFSLGCILVEFYIGAALFQTHDSLEHLAMMEMVIGHMPEIFARSAACNKPEYFREDGQLDWPKLDTGRQSKKDVQGMKSLKELIPPKDAVNQQFLDLLKQLLGYDPAQRISVRDALQHPYFMLDIPMEDL